MGKKQKSALVLAGGLPQIKLIQELKKRGYYVFLADYFANPIAKSWADKFYQKSTLDVDAIRNIAIDEQVDLIITCCTDQALEVVSKLSQELNLPCYVNAEIGLAVTNKRYMKEKFINNGIPTANFYIVKDIKDIKEMKYPVVVKPVDCNSSKGVVKVTSVDEIKKAVNVALDYSRTRTAIIEEYINGIEVSVDLFVCEKRAKILCYSVSDKIQSDNKFVIYRGRYPASISKTVLEKIENASQNIVNAFDLDNCPMLIQILVDNEDIYVIEFSARTGGCVKYHMIELASGVDVIKATVDAFEGKKVCLHPEFSDKFIVDEFIYCKEGSFSEIEGVQECLTAGLLENIYILKSSGETFNKVESSGDRVAAMTYVADSYDDYIVKHNKVVSMLKVLDFAGNDIMRHDLLPEIIINERNN